MRTNLRIVAAAALALGMVALVTGCVSPVKVVKSPTPAAQTLDKNVALDGATSLKTSLDMGVGELKVTGLETSGTAMAGTFVFSPASWKPEVAYTVSGGVGTLSVKQPKSTEIKLMDDNENTWDVRIAKGVPTDLALEFGVGKATVDLRGVELTSLSADSGVGETAIDLSGPRTTGFSGTISSGVGRLTLRLPSSVGARVTGGADGLGQFLADGESVESDSWVNDAYSGSGPKIDLTLNRGIGEVEILLVD